MSKFRAVLIITSFALLAGVSLWAAQEPASDADSRRFLAHVSTDKPIYRAGERVFVRTVILDAQNHQPLAAERFPIATLQVSGPKGEILSVGNAAIQDGVVGYAWDVPAEAAGGQYTITAQFPYQGFPPAIRKFEVRAYRAPRLKGEIVFLRDGFGPGDMVKASLHVERAEGGVPAGAGVSVTAIVDGASAYQGSTVIDSAGNCSVQFKLPKEIAIGDGSLSLAISDGGVVEPIAKTIPILLNTVDITFFPEGGDLIAGLPGRVYLEARTPAKKPADIRGRIIDAQGQTVAEIHTDHEGRGRFTFTPRDGATYSLKLSEPAGIEKLFPLPSVNPIGVTLTAFRDVTEKNQPVILQCASTIAGNYIVTLSKHDMQLSSQMFDLGANKPVSVSLAAPGWADGVLTATVRDANGKAQTERLVFRQSARLLRVNVAVDRGSYVPGDPVSLTITTTDEDGNPVAASVGITATDASVLEMPERRDRAPRLSEMVLLEDDVREFADAQVYLDPADSQSPLAVDLLLGTQGWRRFATDDEARFLAQYGDAGRRALADRQPPTFRFTRLGGFGGGGMMLRDLDARQGMPEGTAAVVDRLGANAEEAKASMPPPADVPVAAADLKDLRLLPWFRAGGGGFGGDMVGFRDIRIYAHDLRPGYQPGQRQDFTETVYWAAAVNTAPDTGKATVTFKLSDSVTSFKISADAFDASGRLGEGTATIRSVEPFYIEPKLPLEVSTGDVIRLPIAAVNGAASDLSVRLTIDGDPSLSIEPVAPFTLPAGGRDRRISQITVGSLPSLSRLRIKADAGTYADEVTRDLVIQPVGFPTEISRGGMLDPNTTIAHSIEIPASLVSGSVVAHVVVYPTPVGNLTEALKGLMQEPNGCFEQTSSTTYPLVMADQYFLTHSGVDPQLIAQSNALLDKGYQRLIGFECKNKGYEWFGEDPGHECLSAYGLLEFTDMSSVRTVDQVMLNDTRNWLMSHRDGKGGFTHARRALHTWIADPDCANGYCTWALLETGQKDLDKEVDWLKNAAASDSNSYVKALAANALFLAGDPAGAKEFMNELASRQQSDGSVAGATTSVVGSEGQSLEIETTSLATLAWLRDPAYAANSVKAIEFLASACQGGRYGSTQSTVLALRAIVEYDRARAHPTAAGKVQLLVDGQPFGDAMAFNSGTQSAITLPDISNRLAVGKHDVELRMTDGSTMPYAMDVSYHSVTPASSDQCKVGVAVSLKDAKLTEGSATEADVTVTNRTDSAIPTPIAIIGLPGGLEVRYDQLKELVKSERIAAYEVRGREVILYWRDLQPNQRVEIPLSLSAAVPGDYTGPASRAYLYYADENKQWIDGLKVTIEPK
jgi:alpha-2-macroglobulin-like protein